MFIKKITPLLFTLLGTALLSACNDKPNVVDDALSLLDTEVYYLHDVVLPEGAKLEVRLEDVSKMDVASELISHSAREVKNSPPYSLQIAFPTELIKMNHRYGLRASIKIDDKLLFISTSHINPFEVGIASPIKIKVEPVGS